MTNDCGELLHVVNNRVLKLPIFGVLYKQIKTFPMIQECSPLSDCMGSAGAMFWGQRAGHSSDTSYFVFMVDKEMDQNSFHLW